jgi:hypothetical protein
MTQSGMMIALAGPKRVVTLVPVRIPIIPLVSMLGQTLVSFFGLTGSALCQNAAWRLTIRVSLAQAGSYFRTRGRSLLAPKTAESGLRVTARDREGRTATVDSRKETQPPRTLSTPRNCCKVVLEIFMPRQSSLGVLRVLGGESCFCLHSPTEKMNDCFRLSFLTFET